MNWGKGIVLTFVIFVGVIATLVTISMKQDVSLVSKDYYVEELAYQDQIDRINNKNSMEKKPEIKKTGEVIVLQLNVPESDGSVHFFRPSNARFDKKYKLAINESGTQVFKASDFEKGFWKVKINWQKDGKEYYSEHNLVL